MEWLQLKAPAKLNLTLDVLSKREDGYHDIESVMHTIDLCDAIRIAKVDSGIHVTCTDASIPVDSRNTAYRAAQILMSEYRIESGVRIEIDKKIPFGAGLGGGSSDAAAVLWGLNTLLGLELEVQELLRLGAIVGSDVPFCVLGGTGLVTGRGEIVEPVDTEMDMWFLLVKPPIAISTKDAYAALDRRGIKAEERPDTRGMLDAIMRRDYQGISSLLCNIMEPPIFEEYPSLLKIKRQLIEAGVSGALMSGSGSVIYGMASDEEDMVRISEIIKANIYGEVFLTRTFNDLMGVLPP